MLLKDMLKDVSGVSAVKGGYVEYGYGQVEPNHLSAQRTGQIYGQLPANKNINLLENGQFVKYDYAAGDLGEVDFVGKGEWMLVYNEIKLYREEQGDCEFAMRKEGASGLSFDTIVTASTSVGYITLQLRTGSRLGSSPSGQAPIPCLPQVFTSPGTAHTQPAVT